MYYQLTAFINSLGGDYGYAENTLQAYANDLQRFFLFLHELLGREPRLKDLSPTLVKQYLEAEQSSGFKLSTLYRRRSTITRFFKFLEERGEITEGLVREDSAEFDKVDSKSAQREVYFLPEEKISQLREMVAAGGSGRAMRDLAILNILLETGLSIGILVGLDLTDLNLRQKRFRVKSVESGETWYPVPNSTDSIQKYLKLGRPDLTQDPDEIAVFVSQLGSRITRQGVWQILKNWGKELKLDKSLSPRIIRHTAARQMLVQGRSIPEIQNLLGHRNPLSTRFLVRRIKTGLKQQNEETN
ncbi:MAG: tyrosine-type recombinase/integrase [Anaerolineae bacterium]|nr:tyrosine-type recombinase/integrase [Anaerolineae bacterium]